MVTVLDELLRVIPGPAGVRQEDRHEHTGRDGSGEVGAEGANAEAEADCDRGENGEQAGCDELTERIAGDDVDHLAVLRLLGALHDARVLAELAAHLEDDRARCTGHGVDRQAREEEHDRSTDDETDEVRRARDIEDAVVLELLLEGLERIGAASLLGRADDRIAECAEQRGRRKHGGRDCDALGDRLGRVADRVEAGEHCCALAIDIARHLGDALGVVGNRTEGVHRDDDADRGEQAGAGECDREEREQHNAAAEQKRAVHGRRDDERRVDRGLESERDARKDDRGCTGERGLRDIVDRTPVRLGEVRRELLDDRGEDDADEHRADDEHTRAK